MPYSRRKERNGNFNTTVILKQDSPAQQDYPAKLECSVRREALHFIEEKIALCNSDEENRWARGGYGWRARAVTSNWFIRGVFKRSSLPKHDSATFQKRHPSSRAYVSYRKGAGPRARKLRPARYFRRNNSSWPSPRDIVSPHGRKRWTASRRSSLGSALCVCVCVLAKCGGSRVQGKEKGRS